MFDRKDAITWIIIFLIFVTAIVVLVMLKEQLPFKPEVLLESVVRYG